MVCSLSLLFCLTYSVSRYLKQPMEVVVGNVLVRGRIGEEYPFTALPHCRHSNKKALTSVHSIEDSLFGRQTKDIGIHLKYGENVSAIVICDLPRVSSSTRALFHAAIVSNWSMTFMLDEGFRSMVSVGYMDERRVMVNNLFMFLITVDGGEVVDFEVVPSATEVMENQSFDLKFGASFRVGKAPLPILNDFFFKHRSHWYGLLGSLTEVVLVVGGVAFVTRLVLSGSTATVSLLEDGRDNWKLLRGDVFRPPRNLFWLASTTGTGIHGVFSLLVFASLSCLGIRAVLARALMAFLAGAPLAGFSGVLVARVFAEEKWARVAVAGASGLPLVLLVSYAISGMIAWLAGSAHRFVVLAVVACVPVQVIAYLLAIVGGWAAVRLRPMDLRENVSAIERTEPSRPWWLSGLGLLIIGGSLTFFGSLLPGYFLMQATWGRLDGYPFEYLLAFTVCLIVLSGSIGYCVAFMLITKEVHHWLGPSFSAPAAGSVLLFIFGIYFAMCPVGNVRRGWPLAYFLTWHAVSCLIAGVGFGGLGAGTASFLVARLYQNMKAE